MRSTRTFGSSFLVFNSHDVTELCASESSELSQLCGCLGTFSLCSFLLNKCTSFPRKDSHVTHWVSYWVDRFELFIKTVRPSRKGGFKSWTITCTVDSDLSLKSRSIGFLVFASQRSLSAFFKQNTSVTLIQLLYQFYVLNTYILCLSYSSTYYIFWLIQIWPCNRGFTTSW